MKILGITFLLLSVASSAFATPVPEIDGGFAVNAIALVGGAVLIIRSRRRRYGLRERGF